MSERRIEVGKNVAAYLLELQGMVTAAQHAVNVAFTTLAKAHDLPLTSKALRIEQDTVVVDVPE